MIVWSECRKGDDLTRALPHHQRAHRMNASEVFNRHRPFFKTMPAMGLGPLDVEFCAV